MNSQTWKLYKRLLPSLIKKTGAIASAEVSVDEFLKNLRLIKIIRKEIGETIELIKASKHQEDALIKALEYLKGCIIIPTSGGKTMVGEMIVLSALLRVFINDETDAWKDCDGVPVFAILSPRIMLNRQLLREFYDLFKHLSHFMIVDSGNVQQKRGKNDPQRDIKHTTSPTELREEFQDCKSANLPFIIVGTYDSALIIQNAGLNVHMLICDEAHHLVSEGNTWITRDGIQDSHDGNFFSAKRKYFFTATRKITDSINGIGMQNEKLFGRTIFSISPADLVWQGRMLGARLLTIRGNITAPSNSPRAIFAGYEALQNQQNSHWENMDPKFKPENPLGSKMIVKMNDTESIHAVLDSDTFRKFIKKNKDVKIYFITSKDGAMSKDDNEKYFSYNTATEKEREVFLKDLNELGDSEKAIIFHIRILREGIDLSGITGIYFTSWTDIIDFLQNFGRAVRLHLIDRKNLSAGIIKPHEYEKMIKPCGWIILPMLNVMDHDLIDGTKEILRELRDNWGYIPNYLTNVVSYTPNKDGDDGDEPDPMSEPNHNRPKIQDPTQNYIAEVWQDVIENEVLSLKDLIDLVRANKISDMVSYQLYRWNSSMTKQMPFSPKDLYEDYPGDEKFFYNYNIWSSERIIKFIKDNDLENPLKASDLDRTNLPSNFPKSIRRYMKKHKNIEQ